MASIRERTTSDGDLTFSVLFRHGKKQTSRAFVTRKAAEKFIARMDLDGIDAALESLEPARPVALTLDDLADRWFEKRENDVKAGELTPRVLTGYRRDYANWIQPYLGGLPAESIDELRVQEWVDRIKVKPGSSAKSVGDRHAILHGIFKWASDPRRGLLPKGHNPCIGTALPKKEKKPPKGLRLTELLQLTTTAYSVDADAADVIEFLAGTGWRLGETVALTVAQVEDDGVNVWVTMSRVWRREVGFTEGAKSSAGYRRLRVLGPAVGVLRRRIIGKKPGDLVFTTKTGLPWGEMNFRNNYFNPIAKAAGLTGERRPTPHWVRHSHVLVCHAAGMDLAEIQRRIGHEDIKMTINTYGKLIEDMNDDVAARLAALLTPSALPQIVRGEVSGSGELE